MVQARTKHTLEEFLKLPETKPASEYIGGQIIQSPCRRESTASYKQSCWLRLTGGRGAADCLSHQIRCTFGGRSIVPDIVVFAWERIPGWQWRCCQHIQGCSRLDDQILSQTRARPITGNILHCLKHGSRLGWLIDPDERSVLVYPPGQELLQEPDVTRSRPSSTAAANGEICLDGWGWRRGILSFSMA